MRLSEFQNKDIIDITTGEKIGNIIDIEIDFSNGSIKKIILYEKKGILNFKSNDETYIYWNQIKKIGSDVILIDKKD